MISSIELADLLGVNPRVTREFFYKHMPEKPVYKEDDNYGRAYVLLTKEEAAFYISRSRRVTPEAAKEAGFDIVQQKALIRNESQFFSVLKGITQGTTLLLEREANVGGYNIDFCVSGPLGVLCIEYDEDHHSYYQKVDKERERKIYIAINYLGKDCFFLRVTDHDWETPTAAINSLIHQEYLDIDPEMWQGIPSCLSTSLVD